MSKYYKKYKWKDGVPFGYEPTEEISKIDTYKIITDPYQKRFSIEKYMRGQFFNVIYDSIFLDFRNLKNPEQTAWQKIPISESEETTVCLIRDQNDRVIFLETHYFLNSLCRECRVSSPQGIPISIHKMYYKNLQDPFNGVVLYDQNDHAVMMKRYEFDEVEQMFTTLLEENWQLDDSKSLVPAK